MSSLKITHSSEVLTNYVQAEAVAPNEKFQALQTTDGHSLLFSIGTDHVLYLIEEFPGRETGWVKNDISSGLASKFPPTASLKVKTFAVDQNQTTNGFCLLIALTVDGIDGEADHLFMATDYSRIENDGIHVDWTEILYDIPHQLEGKSEHFGYLFNGHFRGAFDCCGY